MKTIDEIRIVCSECRREYAVPTGMLETWSMIEMQCKSCGNILRINTLKERVRKEMMEIIERSGYLS